MEVVKTEAPEGVLLDGCGADGDLVVGVHWVSLGLPPVGYRGKSG